MNPLNPIPDLKNKEAFDLVESAVRRFKTEKPLVIGITGAGGAGKTTFGNNLMNFYGPEYCVSIDLDDYLVSREERGKLGMTGYNPRANKLFKAREDISNLKSRKQILKPVYDHSTGKVSGNEIITPKEIVIIEGVTTLYEELVGLNDISFFLDAREETQIQSRVKRDVEKRGYSIDEAIVLYESVKPDYKKFIEPTKKLATVIFIVGTDYIMHPIYKDPKFFE